jgi:hypothetical protein
MFGQQLNLMLHLVTDTNNALPSNVGRASCLLVTPMAQCTDLLGVSGEKPTRNMWFQLHGAAAHFASQF